MTNHISQQLGNYQLVRHLGRGAFSDVYLGIHVHLKTPAAIKILHTELTSSDVEKFRTEARTIARLEHPHIVRVIDFGIEDHTPFLVMSFAPNGTLRQRYSKGTILSLATIISYVTQIADALQYAHKQKFIHRDIKPENMLLGRHNEVLLSDFGFVMIAQSSISQSTKEMAGTIPYMAPEQFHGKPRFASDQYSLGIVVYEWLTGDRPFQGSVLEITTQHMIKPPPPIRIKNSAIPPEVEEVLLTALAKEPQQRFATVQAFANALQQASNLVSPIASASTISFEEASALPSIGTQPLSAVMTHADLTHNTPPAFQTDTFEDSYSNIDSSNNQQLTNLPVVSTTHSQRHLSRRAVLFGLAGVAVGTVVSNGIWLAKSAGLLGGGSSTTLFTYTGHKGSVLTAAWSPDGYRIASGSADYTVKVWDAVSGWHSFTYTGHKDYVWSVALQIRDPFNRTTAFTLSGHTSGVKSVAWSPDGKYIASGSFDQTVRVWDALNGGKPIYTLSHSNYVKSVAWSPDSKYIASSTGDTSSQGTGEHLVYIWNTNTKKMLLKYNGHNDGVATVAWSRDGKLIASAGGNISSGDGDTSVQVWDAFNGNKVLTYSGHQKMVNSVAWAKEGPLIASASWDTTVQVWKVE